MKWRTNSLVETTWGTKPPQLWKTTRTVREIEKKRLHTAYIFPKREGHSGKSSMLRDRKTIRREIPFFLASWSAKRLKKK
jgi:hypothetical protein